MSFSTAMLGMIAALPLAQGIAFGGPAPTAVSADRALEGFTPKPTKGPSIVELRRRQANQDPETCGWVDGDWSSGVTCSIGRTCVLYTVSDVPGMAGCCSGSDTQECGWANSCVNYDDYWSSSSCDSDCDSNTFIRKCTNSAAPYCVTWTYPSDNIADFGCADYDAGVETVFQFASDSSDTTSITLPTISDDAVTGWDGSSTDSSSTDEPTSTDDTIFPNFTTETTDGPFVFPTGSSSGGGGGSSSPTTGGKTKTKKKGVSVGAIAGAVVAGLFVLFLIIAAVIFLCVKKKKSAQLAQNNAAIAAAQASRPQSQYPQQPNMMPPPQMAQQPPPPVAPMSPPQPGYNGYFVPPQDQKINPQTQVHEYGAPSPISNPSTPAPAYAAPYYADAPPMPTQSPVQYGAREPTPGTHEVDAISAVRPPQAQSPAPSAPQGPVFEMGQGK